MSAAVEARAWQLGGYGFASTPAMAPDVSLSQVVAAVGRMARPGAGTGSPRPAPDGLYPGHVRATLPESGERFRPSHSRCN